MTLHRTLFAKFQFVIIPIFFVLAAVGMWFLSNQDLKLEKDRLAARVGNLAGRTATALAQPNALAEREHAQALLAPLASDRAISCLELRSTQRKTVLGQHPPAQGCAKSGDKESFSIPVTNDGDITLFLAIDESEITETAQLRWNIALAAILAAFIIAIFSTALGFQFIISRRLRALQSTIRLHLETGERPTIENAGNDELGEVIEAFNRMLVQDAKHERDLDDHRQNLEAEVKKRTTELARRNNELSVEIQERRSAEQELEQAKILAETANQAKSEFLSSMSHELRTPLNSILGFTQLMESNPAEPLSEQQTEAIKHILAGGHQLLELIDEVLELSKIETGTFDLDPKHVVPAEVFKECLELMRPMAEARGVTMSETPGEIDGIYVDANRFKRIILNLMSNGIKYNVPNGELKFGCHRTGEGEVYIFVSDTGLGIAPERQEEVFQPFNRLGHENSNIEGTGIGLVISKRLVEAMDGEIGFDSIAGEGTTFWIKFPEHRGEEQRGEDQFAVTRR
ncbi:MAG: ATP-binding protein [Proteobacteria bacterium]|nr:ATP-binding protein [Pseudomonadota bacterium]